MGEIRTVHAIGSALAVPELATVGDVDSAIISLEFAGGGLGVVDLSRNSVYGYDIATEILGTRGALRVGYLRENPLLVMTKSQIAHDTVPFFIERFAEAYTTQLQDFVDNALHEREPSVTLQDGIEALRVGLAATQSLKARQSVEVAAIAEISGDSVK